MDSDLIFDIGLHKGEDTDFYLRKGFRVVAVEANPEFARECEIKFKQAVDTGQLTIVNKAISDVPGPIDFYVNEYLSVWGTANLDWVKRNERHGTTNRIITVEADTIASLIDEFGVPFYMKVDIEGNDIHCLTGLRGVAEKPRYISVESSATSVEDTLEQLAVLSDLGYTRFKIVSQYGVPDQVCPNPAREGNFIDHTFEPHSSGLFGEETPGTWKNLAWVRWAYRWVHFECRMVSPLNGVFRKVKYWRLQRLLSRMFPRGKDWFDTHATY